MAILKCTDVESTGLTEADSICELGWCAVGYDGGESPTISTPFSMVVVPKGPISIEAMSVHHITEEEAARGCDVEHALALMLADADVLVAHVAKFEQQFIKTDKPWICTWKVALHHASHAPGHSLQVLRYWLKLAVDPVLAMPPHRAGPDAYVCAALLARMLAKISIDEMIEISSRPALLPKLRFGKHGELPLAQVPKDYLRWILTQDFDEDVKYTANHYLKL